MPTYVYKRDDGTTFEVKQRITEDALEVCPTTGQKVKRVISGAGLIFKGDGFYLTDYVRKKVPDEGASSKSTESDTAATTATTDTKKADKKKAAKKADS